MRVNEVIVEGSLYDLVKQTGQIGKQAQAAKKAPTTYNKAIDRFQQELEVDSPEDAAELSNLRTNYKANPSYKNAMAISKFILNKGKYTKDKETADRAAAEALKAMQELKSSETPTSMQTPASAPAGPSPETIPAYLRKGRTAPTTIPAATTTPPPSNAAAAKKPMVINVNGEDITKTSDGSWYDEDGAKIVNPSDIKELEKRLDARSNPASAAAYVPPAKTSKPYTSPSNRSRKRRRK